jgi:hypothetical protein
MSGGAALEAAACEYAPVNLEPAGAITDDSDLS